jgi:hypothetical protein
MGRLNKLLANVPILNEAAVLGALTSAALRACEDIGYRALPLRFVVADGAETQNPLSKGKK